MGAKERKERERLRYRNDIIDAAEEIFFSKGIPSATMDKIASLAEVSKATLYNHFKSKDELLYAVHLRGEEILFKLTSEIYNSTLDTKETIRALMEVGIQYHQTYPNHFQINHHVVANKITIDAENEDKKRFGEIEQINLSRWIDLVERGKNEGVIRKDINAVNVGLIMAIQLNGFLYTYSLIAEEFEAEFPASKGQILEDYFKLTFNGILEPCS